MEKDNVNNETNIQTKEDKTTLLNNNDKIHLYVDNPEDNKTSKKKKRKFKFNKPSFNLIEMFALVIITGVLSSIASGVVMHSKTSTSNGTTYADLLEDENVLEFLDVYATISDDYYEDIDKSKAIEGAISGLMSSVGDKYTSYLDEDSSESLESSLKGTYEGIGISLSNQNPGQIVKVYNDTPASEAGLQDNDYITAVDGETITEENYTNISTWVKERKTITLTIARNNETFDVTLTIREINSPAISYKMVENTTVGYLYIDTFSATLANQVESALKELENLGMTSLIIDLRYNGGGLLSSLQDTAEIFTEKNKIIYSMNTKGKIEEYKDSTSSSVTYPIVVLINGSTASASEMLAASLKENNNAIVVGNTSYGKGKVQHSEALSNGSSYKYTVATWLTPSGNCIDGVGITPDYEVNLTYTYDENNNIVDYVDTQYYKALSILTGDSSYEEIGNDTQVENSEDTNVEE